MFAIKHCPVCAASLALTEAKGAENGAEKGASKGLGTSLGADSLELTYAQDFLIISPSR